jgi:hypothetical protein
MEREQLDGEVQSVAERGAPRSMTAPASATVTAASPSVARRRARSGDAGLAADVLGLQRRAGNAAVGRWLARSVSPPEAPGAALAGELAQLDPAVRDVLHRRGHSRVSRPHGGWVVSQASEEYIDFDWTALLFILHRSDARTGTADYFTVLDRLMIPALRAAAASDKGRTPDGLPNLDILTAGMWARNPPAYIDHDRSLHDRWQQDLEGAGVEGLLTEAGTRARQANITDLSIPGRRDQDYAFILGQPEGRGSHNAFYRTARDYYRTKLGRGHVFVVTSLQGVLDWIRARAAAASTVAPLGTLYLISHANEEGQLMARVTPGGPDGFYPFELVRALSANGRIWWDAHGNQHTERLTKLGSGVGVDFMTRVFIRGCDLGNNPAAMTAMREAFGGDPLVEAPRHAQYYGPSDRGRHATTEEGLADTYSLAFPADQRVNDDGIADRLAAKYPSITLATFRDWLRKGRHHAENTYQVSDYSVPDEELVDYPTAGDVPTSRSDQETATRNAVNADSDHANIVDFDNRSWHYRRRGSRLIATGTTRYVHLHVVRRDASGALRQFSLRDREAYAIDVQPVGASMTSTPWR